MPQLQDALIDSSRRFPDKVALVCGHSRLTFHQLHRRSSAVAAALVERGVGRSDRVVIFSDDPVQVAIAFWAVLKANAVVSVVSPQTRAGPLADLLNDTRATGLVTGSALARELLPAARRAPHLSALLVAGEVEAVRVPGLPEPTAWAEAEEDGDERAVPRRNLELDLAVIHPDFDGAGQPRGVMLTHRNLLASTSALAAGLGCGCDEVVLSALPLSSPEGLTQLLLAARLGTRLVQERGFARPAELLGRIAQEAVTTVAGGPALFARLCELPRSWELDLSPVHTLTSMTGGLPPRHRAGLEQLFPNARLFTGFGLPECAGITLLPPEALARKPGSVGAALPNTELWIVDADDRRLGPNEIGQLVVRGAAVMRGYWERPGVTARRLRPGPLPGEWVLYTGELARVDEDGDLTCLGRMDPLNDPEDAQVSPAEVEQALLGLRGVKDASVFAVPDPLHAQALQALVVLEPAIPRTSGPGAAGPSPDPPEDPTLVPTLVPQLPAR